MATVSQGRFKSAEQYNNAWGAALQADQSLEDALAPEFWSHVANMLKPHDTIRLIPEKGDYYALLIVVSASRNFAKVKLLSHVPLTDEVEGESDIPSELSVKWQGPHVKYAVIRKSDAERIKDGFTLKADAEQWARDHLAAMAR